ncbi:MAG: hypothetical protein ABI261_03700 [Ginsengibacter sp.]
MIGFIVPIKPKKFSKDWEYENKLLERTLRSITQQTDQCFKVFVVYNKEDKPEIDFEHSLISWIRYDFPFVEVEKIADYKSFVYKWHKPDYAEKMFDKGRKISYGCSFAKKMNCDYIMAIDSDDLISNRIASFVNEYGNSEPGWYICNGYMYNENSKILVRSRQLHNINGSTFIIRKDLVPDCDFASLNFMDYNFFEAHGYLLLRIKQLFGLELAMLPFYGTVYVLHPNNSSDIFRLFNSSVIKKCTKYFLFGKLMNKGIRKEFNLFNL